MEENVVNVEVRNILKPNVQLKTPSAIAAVKRDIGVRYAEQQSQNQCPVKTTKQTAECRAISDKEMKAHVDSFIQTIPVSDAKLQDIIELQDEDVVCKELKRFCLEGWPIKDRLTTSLKPYWSERASLAVVNNLLVKESRIVMPSAMRLEVLDKIHEGHQGITKCRARAKSAVWWPGLSREIQDMFSNCRICAKQQEARKEPLMPTPMPERPWQVIATDLFQLQSDIYLLIIDYFS
ncbi:Uncharacterized protein K02A2.6 [Exaiptasia diaphana]|nr:Uncharacterized protein K02A2.6 [Exaiptasia diaphana]